MARWDEKTYHPVRVLFCIDVFNQGLTPLPMIFRPSGTATNKRTADAKIFRRDNITFLQFPVLALSDAARRVSTILGISVQTDVLRLYKKRPTLLSERKNSNTEKGESLREK